MARAGYVVGGILLMFFSIPLGLLLFSVTAVVGLGITGFVLFIYGLVAHSDLEKAVLTRPPVVIYQPAQLPYPQPPASLGGSALPPAAGRAFCPYCGTANSTGAKYCGSCGKELPELPGEVPGA